jgi:hypothetical protein
MLRLRSATNKNPLSVRKLVIRYPEPVTSTPLSVRKTSFSITNQQSPISGHLDTFRHAISIQVYKSVGKRVGTLGDRKSCCSITNHQSKIHRGD